MIETISPEALKAKLENANDSPVLLDVREPDEYQICHIHGSIHIPMGEITRKIDDLDESREIVVICHHGMRSMQVAMYLHNQGFAKISNLEGGIDRWAISVEPSMRRY